MSRRPERFTAVPTAHCLPHCTGCGVCVSACPTRALHLTSEHPGGRGRKTAGIDAIRCTGCGACLPACPRQALVLTKISPKIKLCK